MTEMMRNMAARPSPRFPTTSRWCVAVRLDYLTWEDTTGLPGRRRCKADRRSALAGKSKSEEQ